MRQDGRDSQAGGTVQMEWRFRPRPCKGRKRRPGDAPQQQGVEPGNVPRISRLMALAIKFDGQIREGAVTDYASLARLGFVTPARISQIMALLNLAPDIQEEILFLPRTTRGRDPIRECHLRPIAAVLDWRKQRRVWEQILDEQNLVQEPTALSIGRGNIGSI